MRGRTRHAVVAAAVLAALAAIGAGAARLLDDSSGSARATTAALERTAATARTRVAPPRIVSWPIPFPAKRRKETARYALRHYGIDDWRIRGPHTIVEHYTATDSLQAVHATFSADNPDPELGELPGVCSHFVIGKDGTIYRLVPLTTMCRHTVGLNWTAIGIEHVALSDADVLGNPKQLAASLRLTLWLMQRYDIPLRDVIGHNESLQSPYHRERYARWRCQTHGDWTRADMVVYRRRLVALARSRGVAALAPSRQITGPTGRTPGC
jgi:N-acetylmuramoyl-L-alanine amidase